LECSIRDDADIPLSKSGTAVGNRPLPSSAGQVCTGPAIVNQLDPFLPPCPITARYNVIPAGYDGRLHADLSHQLLVDQAAARMRSSLTRWGLRIKQSSDEGARKFFRRQKIRPCPGAIQTHCGWSPRRWDAVSGNRRF